MCKCANCESESAGLIEWSCVREEMANISQRDGLMEREVEVTVWKDNYGDYWNRKCVKR